MSAGSVPALLPPFPPSPPTAAGPGGAGGPSPRRFTVAEYHRLIQAGVLAESERVELLEGWIVQSMSRNTPHDTALDKTEEAIRSVLPGGWRVRSQRAITTGDSEPEPDCAIVSGDLDAYAAKHPTPQDIAFVVEVADTSVWLDRTIKGRIYGRAGVLIYWVVNVRDRQVEVYVDPTGPTEPPEAAGYRSRQDYREADSVPVVIQGQEVARIPVFNLLPRV